MDWVQRAEALLVLGSSLTVWSGYRFAKRAHDLGIPLALVNIGPTRADPLCTVRIDGSVSHVLSEVHELLNGKQS